ncbi:phospholipase carboxylesterase [Pyrenophora seminiperda CCB06]|uniref:Phospholipase carboxylesterase n=1 Tax=Pyrenophora seminiperda CCB06 TaxID=1302712 RepID=A0A3M7MFI7_9PLEO|nr:phospholipase carboxylesterase [Pyrenophora seminiperda CCB06]
MQPRPDHQYVPDRTSSQNDLPIPPHTIQPTGPHKHTVIFLHGRGSDAETFASEIFESQDSSSRFFTDIFPSVKWLFPRAPFRFPEREDDDESRRTDAKEETSEAQWFNMTSPQRPQEDREKQKPNLWKSVDLVMETAKQEIDIVGMQHVVLAGISQGCATGIFTLLATGMQVGGFVGLCGWLPLAEELKSIMHVPGREQDVTKMPVLLQHCRDDQVVPVENGEDLRKRLEEIGMQVEWDCFDEGGHWLHKPEGMDGVVRFIQDIFNGV